MSAQDLATSAGLSAAAMEAWRAFLRAHSFVVNRLEAELVADQRLPLASYDVLVQLSEAPGRALRMTELADRVLLSRSGLTRLADRLAAEGLIRREACPSDARGTMAVLTDCGFQRLRAAWPGHARGVAEYFADRFDEGELATLATLLSRLGPARACAVRPSA